MKKKLNFWQSLEKYVWVMVRRSPLPYTWVGVGLITLVLIASIANVKNSVAGASSEKEVIEQASGKGDYILASELYDESSGMGVLGAETELENLIYPKEKLMRETRRWEELLEAYPGNREIMRGLASLYKQAGELEKAGQLSEQVRIMDPSGE